MDIFGKMSRFLKGRISESINDPVPTLPQNAFVSELSPFDVPILDVIEKAEISVRLSNCLKNSPLPFNTISEYIQHSDPLTVIRSFPNAGKKTAKEFDDIIKDFIDNPQKYIISETPAYRAGIENLDSEVKKEVFYLLQHYKFPDFILSLKISVRLENILSGIQNDLDRPFQNLADCLSAKNRFDSYFLSRSSMGRKTLSELRTLVNRAYLYILEQNGLQNAERGYISSLISFEERENNICRIQHIKQDELIAKLRKLNSNPHIVDLLPLNIDENTEIPNFDQEITDEVLRDIIKGIIDEREYDVLSRRTGFQHKKTDTLEEIAIDYNCTRERIRQIEKKAYKKLSPLKDFFLRILEDDKKDIEESLFEECEYFGCEEKARRLKQISGRHQLAIEVVYKNFEIYLESLCQKYKDFWIKSDISEQSLKIIQTAIDNGSAYSPVKKRIVEAIYQSKWPLKLTELENLIPEISTAALMDSLKQDFEAVIDGDTILISGEKLKSSLRIILALRYAGRAVTLSEARYFHNQLFGTDINEHVAGAILGRLAEALIVERGKYALYETIQISMEEINSIREKCWNYLNEKQTYTSTKRIFEDIFIGTHSYGADFNSYMLLGILQDDNRFVCKRGLMLGLNSFSEKDFISLTEQIHGIVSKHGPIDIKGIQEQLSEHRKVLDITVGIMLDNSEEYIKIAPSTYDHVSKVIGKQADCEKLTSSIEISLLEGDLSVFSLQERLEAVKLEIPKYPLLSWLDKKENISRKKSIVHLDAPSTDVQEYNKRFIYLKNTEGLEIKRLQEQLKNEFPALASADYRLTGKHHFSSSDDNKSELDNLLKELNF